MHWIFFPIARRSGGPTSAGYQVDRRTSGSLRRPETDWSSRSPTRTWRQRASVASRGLKGCKAPWRSEVESSCALPRVSSSNPENYVSPKIHLLVIQNSKNDPLARMSRPLVARVLTFLATAYAWTLMAIISLFHFKHLIGGLQSMH